MLSRREVLAPLAFGAIGSAARALSFPAATASLRGLGCSAAASGQIYGCATSTYQVRDSDFGSALVREAKILVPEYEMKRGVLEPQPGTYNFAASDALLQFARAKGLLFRGHTLVWHKANPPWLEDALTGGKDDLLTKYIQTVAARYRGQLHSWDVVNEAIAPGSPGDLRQSAWLKAFGSDYIDLAFQAAREADPAALLVYNDQGCEGGAAENEAFRAATLNFLERAIARRVPIEVYGMQSHLQAFGPALDQRKLRDLLEQVKALGLRILVTEHDVDDGGGPLDPRVRDQAVADASRRFLEVVLDNSATLGVLTWGLSDRFLDFPGWRAALKGYSPRMLPLDANLVRKPLWSAIAASFAGRQPFINPPRT